MESRSFYNEILTEHNVSPYHKHDIENPDIVLEGVNPNCGDDIWLKLKCDGDIIADAGFTGDGCAVSQARYFLIAPRASSSHRLLISLSAWPLTLMNRT